MAMIPMIRTRLTRSIQIYWPYLILILAILAPLLTPGFVLTLDMVFTPTIPLPTQVTSSYGFYALLHALNLIIPADIIQKLILIAIVALASIGMHRLLATLRAGVSTRYSWELYAASLFYTVNPFTYGRFMAGQFAVLLGYALLPWLLRRMYLLWHQPTVRQAVATGLLLGVLGVVSIHSLGLVAVIAIVSLGVELWGRSLADNIHRLRAAGTAVLIGIGASSYWLLPLLVGQGATAETVAQFGPQDSQVFTTTGHNFVNQVIHLARLQGFWLEARNMFITPQDVFPLWGLVVLSLWFIVGYGIRVMWRTSPRLLIYTVICMAVAVAASLGYPFIWLQDHWALAAGFREPHKFAGLIALSYSIIIAFAGGALRQKWHQRSELKHSLALGGFILLPIVLTPVMFWGFANQLHTASYPLAWQKVNQRLNQDTDAFSVLYLPWHQYMSYSFAGRIIATPAHAYFDKPMITSDDPELDGATAVYTSSSSKATGAIVADAALRTDMGKRLAAQNIKYVVVVKEYDYRTYAYLQNQDGLEPVLDTKNIILYRNHHWRKQ